MQDDYPAVKGIVKRIDFDADADMNDGNLSDHKRDPYQIILSDDDEASDDADGEKVKPVRNVVDADEIESEQIDVVLNPEDDDDMLAQGKPARIIEREEEADMEEHEEESSVMDVDEANQILALDGAENFF